MSARTTSATGNSSFVTAVCRRPTAHSGGLPLARGAFSGKVGTGFPQKMRPSNSCEAVCVDPAKVRLVWPRVSRLIYAAMKRGDISPFSAVEDAVLCGDALLWIVRDGLEIPAAAVTELQQTEWR